MYMMPDGWPSQPSDTARLGMRASAGLASITVHLSPAESAAVVGDLRRARRRQRVASIHWIDALYQVYVTGILAVVAIVLLSGTVGDGEVGADTLVDVADHGPAVLGTLLAVAIFMGLRSGSRGGPLALERPDVRHVLLAPVDRGVALRGPAWRQLRFMLTAAAGIGAVAGQLALRRLPGNPVFWMVAGALFLAAVVGVGYGCALLASGTKLPGWVATLVGGIFVGWAVGDVVGSLPTAPTTWAGHLPLWPLEPAGQGFDIDPLGLIGPIAAIVLIAFGMRFVAGTSLEGAERRTALVGQLRFAVTLQDLRTVLVLRRQLAQEHPRSRPWVPAIGHAPRFVVFNRGVRSLARWPLSRIIRLVLMATIAALCLRAVWSGTTPVIILAGLALWVVALDAAEPLGQEVDHPGRTESFPITRGEMLLKHLPIAIVVTIGAGLLAGALAALPFGAQVPLAPALIAGASGGLLAACGAVVTIVQGAPGPVDTLSMTTPEIAGMRTVYRTAFPPALAVLGLVPLLAARAAERGISDPPPASAATTTAFILTFIAILVAGWVRFRDDIHRTMAEAAEQASPSKMAERQRQERLDAEEREAEAIAESRRLAGVDDDHPQPKPKPKPKAKPSDAPEGVQGGTSAKPIGRRRDQR